MFLYIITSYRNFYLYYNTFLIKRKIGSQYKTSWGLLHQITGWILKPCWSRSQIPKFQCLLLESGQMLEWSGKDIEVCWRLLDARYWGKPTLPQRRRRIFLVAEFGGTRARKILFKTRKLQSFLASCGEDRLPSTTANRRSSEKARRKIPVVRPFQERRMSSTAKNKNRSRFIGSFGQTNDPFTTMLRSF